MKNLILILMVLVVMACGKEEGAAVSVNTCPAGIFKRIGGTMQMAFAPTGEFAIDTIDADGCFYEGTHICNAEEGLILLNFVSVSDPSCGDAAGAIVIGFNYTGGELATSQFGMPGMNVFTWSKQ